MEKINTNKNIIGLGCRFESTTGWVAENEGNSVEHKESRTPEHKEPGKPWTLEDCTNSCDDTNGCNSFAYCSSDTLTHCHLKDKILIGKQVKYTNGECTTFYRKCDQGI